MVAALFFGSAVVNWVSLYVQDITITKAGQGILLALRRDMFSHMQKQSMRFFDKTEVGRIMSRVQGDVYQLQEFLGTIVMTVGDFLSLGGIVVVMLLLDVQLGLLALVVLPLLAIAMTVWQPIARRTFIKARATISIVNASLNENITGVRVVQAMNRQDENLRQFDVKNRSNLNAFLGAGRLSAGVLPVVDFLPAAAIGLVLYFGSRMVTDGAIEIGLLIAFIMYIQRFFDPIRNLTMQYTQLQRAMASGTRIFETLDVEPDMVDAPDAVDLPPVRGEVELRNVSFAYKVQGEDVIQNLSLRIEPGQTAAIVGPTGAGKTTLVSLIARFYDVERGRGEVLVDGARRARRGADVARRPDEHGAPGAVPLLRHRAGEHQVQPHRRVRREDDGGGEGRGSAQLHQPSSKTATTPTSRSGARTSASASASSSALPAPSSPTPRYSSSTRRRPTSTATPRRRSSLRCGASSRAGRPSSSRTASPPFAGPTRSSSSVKGELIEEGTHDELLDRDGLYSHLYHMNYAVLEEIGVA